MSRPLSLAFVCLLLAGVALGQSVVAAPLGGSGAAAVDGPSAQAGDGRALATPQQFESTRFVVTVYANGSARWTFKHFTGGPLNDSERAQFQDYAERFRTEETDLWTNFQDSAAGLTAAGSDATGRNMTATKFTRTAGLNPQGNSGVVEMSFLWTNFAQVAGDSVTVGDVFQGEFYVGESQQLVFQAGPDLSLVTDRTAPEPDSTTGGETASVSWAGPQSFADDNPQVVFTSGEPDALGNGGGVATTTGNPDQVSNDGGGLLPIVLVGVLVVAVGAGAGIAWRTGMFGSTTTETDDTDGPAGGAAAETEPEQQAAGEPDEESPIPDEELLTDEDRVLSLLEDNGGRMKQANIVDETGWSKSKVSMLLSDMEDEEHISKLRVGRENIISLKGHEPDAAGSPFDDE
ncbi:helix-turn-helix transcriptional regulator [Halorientalis pallida]|uniref:helix-turn-helix transcriptional regulator n=1 Tax=Halorientalis pallida TaxID=2479928 RepID=UPI003C6FFA06